MHKNKTVLRNIWMSAMLLAVSCYSLANQQDSTETVLSDKVHQIEQQLESATSVNHYSFTAVRGQDVLLGTPRRETFNKLWKLEYQVDGGKWLQKNNTNPNSFSGLNPGAVINIRVSAVEGAEINNTGYTVVLGSYPHMTYDLHHEEGLLRIPYGFSDPAFLATQAIEKSLLEVRFWDSKGAPLEGGKMNLDFKHWGPVKLGAITLISGNDGTASRLLEFGKCQGGQLADYFTQKQEKGRNTWATRYQTGNYTGTNVLLEDLADKPHTYNFGHICNRFLSNWTRN